MEGQGRSDVLGAQSDYEKLLGDLFTKGGTNVAHSYDTAVKGAAAWCGGQSGGSGNLCSAYKGSSCVVKEQVGTLGDTTGATYGGGGSGGSGTIRFHQPI